MIVNEEVVFGHLEIVKKDLHVVVEVKKSLKFVIIEIATLRTLRRDFKSRNFDKEL